MKIPKFILTISEIEPSRIKLHGIKKTLNINKKKFKISFYILNI